MKRLAVLILLALLVPASPAVADAIVVVKAMTADTIAEIFVTDGEVRVDLEIGARDLKAFGDLLPDGIREILGLPEAPFADRARRFFAEDWVMRADDGSPLVPQIERMEPRKRQLRDEITGDPLPVQPEDAENVVFIGFRYEIPGRPKSLTIHKSRDTGSVGFVLYHEGIAVNDFRYLPASTTVDLDWDDPWFSRFRRRSLYRQYLSPVQAFLYVDHFEVRKEIIIRPRDLERWIDLGIGDREVIPAAEQAEIKRRAAAFLATKNPVTVDGKPVEGVLARIHFVRRSLRQTGVIDPPEDLPAVSATLGVIFVYAIEALPKQVEMRWELFDAKLPTVPAVATDEAGPLPGRLTAEDPFLTWQNFLKKPSDPSLATIDSPKDYGPGAPWPAIAIAAIAAVFFARKKWKPALATLVLALATAAVLLLTLGGSGMPPEVTTEVTGGLLKNVYRSFDYRAEGAIYDALSRSVTGDLLTETYLETRKSLELANQGGAMAKVRDVVIESAEAKPIEDGFESRATWTVTGAIGHWGHIHQRKNRYDAVITVRDVEGQWKITKLRLLSEERL